MRACVLGEYNVRVNRSLVSYMSTEYTRAYSICSTLCVCVCVFVSDALGTFARTIGQEHFRQLSVECVELGMV